MQRYEQATREIVERMKTRRRDYYPELESVDIAVLVVYDDEDNKPTLKHQGYTDLPSTPPGSDMFVIVAVRRGHNAKIYTFPAIYANQYTLQYNDEPSERQVTGFFTHSSAGDDDYLWQPLLDRGDELVAWAQIPQYEVTDAHCSQFTVVR